MGKEQEPQKKSDINDETLEIRCVSNGEGNLRITGRAIIIPNNFSSGALKEILSGIVWGETSRSIVYFPQKIEGEEPEIISDEVLKALRDDEMEDRLSQLDMDAMTLKSSPLKMLVEQI